MARQRRAKRTLQADVSYQDNVLGNCNIPGAARRKTACGEVEEMKHIYRQQPDPKGLVC